MLIGYRDEEPGDLLRIHSAHRLLQALLLLFLLACVGLPLLLRGEVAGRSGGDMAVALLALIALPALGRACAWYFPVRETLELDRVGRRAQRHRRNLFGGRARLEELFALEDGGRLQLQRIGAPPAPVRLWLLGRDGDAHRLSFETVAVRPGTAMTNAWLRRIAAHLHLELPGEIVVLPPLRPQEARTRPALPAPAATTPGTRRDDDDAIAPGIRAVLALLGCLLAAFEAIQAFALLRAVFTGTLYSSFWRGRIQAHHWDVPGSFLLQASVGGRKSRSSACWPGAACGWRWQDGCGSCRSGTDPSGSVTHPSRRVRGRSCTTTS